MVRYTIQLETENKLSEIEIAEGKSPRIKNECEIESLKNIASFEVLSGELHISSTAKTADALELIREGRKRFLQPGKPLRLLLGDSIATKSETIAVKSVLRASTPRIKPIIQGVVSATATALLMTSCNIGIQKSGDLQPYRDPCMDKQGIERRDCCLAYESEYERDRCCQIIHEEDNSLNCEDAAKTANPELPKDVAIQNEPGEPVEPPTAKDAKEIAPDIDVKPLGGDVVADKPAPNAEENAPEVDVMPHGGKMAHPAPNAEENAPEVDVMPHGGKMAPRATEEKDTAEETDAEIKAAAEKAAQAAREKEMEEEKAKKVRSTELGGEAPRYNPKETTDLF